MQKRIAIPRRPGPRTTIQPTDVPVYYDNGDHFVNLTGAQLEAIVRQGLPMLSEDARREIAAEAYEDLEEQTLPEPETALEASEVEALWFTIRQCRSIDHGSVRHRACDRAAAALRRLSGTSEPGAAASPATGSRRSPFEAVVELAIAVKDNPDAADALGVKADDYGLDVAEAVARWAKSYRAPETSGLKESLQAALRTHATRYASTPAEAMEELDRLADHLAATVSGMVADAPPCPITPEDVDALRVCAVAAAASGLPVFASMAAAAAERLAAQAGARTVPREADETAEKACCSAGGPSDPETPHDWRLYRLEQFSDAHALQIAGLESEVKTLRADLEGVGRRAAEAVEGYAARIKTLEVRADGADFRADASRGPSGN